MVDLRRVRVWEWLTGLAGVVLLVSLFLPWYGVDGQTATGWESLTVIDAILAVIALGAIALVPVAAVQRTAAVPQSISALLVGPALAAAVLAVIRLVDVPTGGDTRQAGVWIAAIGAIALLLCDWRSMADTRFPAALRPRLDVTTIPSPGPHGERRDIAS